MSSFESPLQILAGPTALRHIRAHGFRLVDIDVLVGAAGGAKFLMLAGLDRVLFRALAETPRARPLHCVGSSIGSWRLACLACTRPAAAIDRLSEAYLAERRYRPRAAGSVIEEIRDDLLAAAFDGESAAAITGHPNVRLHILATRTVRTARRDGRKRLALRLGLAAMGNLLSRRTLGWQFERAVFHSRGEAGPLAGLDDLPTSHLTLDGTNLHSALSASAALPFVMEAVAVGGVEGRYRDGGLLDYNPVFTYLPVDSDGDQERARATCMGAPGLVLYPHYFDYLTPGWFDRALRSRRVGPHALDRTILLAPSESFIRRLPGGARPRRADFSRFDDRERERRWRAVWAAGAELGAALGEILASGRLESLVRPFRESAAIAGAVTTG